MFNFDTADSLERVSWLGLRLQAQNNFLTQCEQYLTGTQPAAFLSPDVAGQLQGKLSELVANYPSLIVSSLAERLTVTGFKVNGATEADSDLWQAWQRCQFRTFSDLVHRDALGLGRSYVSVWAGPGGQPVISPESPRQVYPYRDPRTRQITGVLKMWSYFDDLTSSGQSYAVLYLADRIETFINQSPGMANAVPPVTGWEQTGSQPNPLGRPPIVEFLNARNVLDVHGSPEFADVVGLVDALAKTLQDSMVASEYTAMPRRWATGLAVPEDDNGTPINPFAEEKSRVWSVEDAAAKFGQFAVADLKSYTDQAALLVRQIGALSGLPEYLLGLPGIVQPTSADAIRAANLGLTTRAYAKADLLGASWAQVGQLVKAIQTGARPESFTVAPLWAPIEDRSQAMTADAISKLVAAGVPLALALQREAGWSPEELQALERAQQREAIRQAVSGGTNDPTAD